MHSHSIRSIRPYAIFSHQRNFMHSCPNLIKSNNYNVEKTQTRAQQERTNSSTCRWLLDFHFLSKKHHFPYAISILLAFYWWKKLQNLGNKVTQKQQRQVGRVSRDFQKMFFTDQNHFSRASKEHKQVV